MLCGLFLSVQGRRYRESHVLQLAPEATLREPRADSMRSGSLRPHRNDGRRRDDGFQKPLYARDAVLEDWMSSAAAVGSAGTGRALRQFSFTSLCKRIIEPAESQEAALGESHETNSDIFVRTGRRAAQHGILQRIRRPLHFFVSHPAMLEESAVYEELPQRRQRF